MVVAAVCACAPNSREYASPGAPEWVRRGGASSGLPDSQFVTGFGESRDRESGIETAKHWAVADLTRRISVRIQSRLIDSYRESGAEIEESLNSQIHATTDIRLEGIRYEVHREGEVVWALAVLERLPAAAARRRSRDLSIAKVEACLKDGAEYQKSGLVAASITAYQSCRVPLQMALEDDALAAVLSRAGLPADQGSERLATLALQLERVIRSLPDEVASNIQDAAENLAYQLAKAGVVRGRQIDVSPFVYGSWDVSSPFGREIAMALESAIGRSEVMARMPKMEGSLVLRGMFREVGGVIRIRTTARALATSSLVAGAEVTLSMESVPRELQVRPKNFDAYLLDAEKLADNEAVQGGLRVEIRTSKGSNGLVYEEGEELDLFIRVNQPAWIRLIYVLTNGDYVPIEQNWYLDASRVNRLIEYPERFEIVPPFGVELIHVMAYTERPPLLRTRPTRIERQDYLVIADGADQIVRHRGIARKDGQQVAERTLQITTMKGAIH